MLYKNNMANLDNKSKKNNAKHIFPSFFLFFFFFFFEKNNKTPYHGMHECYAMQILKTKRNQKKKKGKEEWSQRVEK